MAKNFFRSEVRIAEALIWFLLQLLLGSTAPVLDGCTATVRMESYAIA